MSEPFQPPNKDIEQRLCRMLAARPCGLFTDVDGTISAIAPTPEAATLLPGVAELLEEATSVFDVVAAVSGRAARDAAQLVGNPHLLYVGNHGMESYQPGSDTLVIAPAAEPYIPILQTALAEIGARIQGRWPAARIEPKGATASIHVRGTSDPMAAQEEVYQMALAVTAPVGLQVTQGRMIVELRPPVALDKGTALAEVIHELGLRGALYLGDDTTDLDAFRALRQLTAEGVCLGISVAVLHAHAPAELRQDADLALAAIEQVPPFLRWLLTVESAQ